MANKLDSSRVPAQQMALRVAMISTIAFVLFGIAFFRLWYLQVLDGGKYLAEARANRVRVEPVQAPRGVIKDVNGKPIVANRRSVTLTLDPRAIPDQFRTQIAEWGEAYGAWNRRGIRVVGAQPKDFDKLPQWRAKAQREIGPAPAMPQATGAQWALYERLGKVLRRSPERINATVVSSIVQVPWSNVAIKRDVDRAQRSYVGERQDQFPGVAIQQVYMRSYPAGDAAAQTLGTVGEIPPDEIGSQEFKGVEQGGVVGRSGLERQYDQFLRGTDGKTRIEVNALGERRGQAQSTTPRPGRDLQLTIDLKLQKYAQQAMATVAGGLPGAFVALNPKTGAIYAIGSMPTFNPRDLQGPFESAAEYRARFQSDASGHPLFNRAIAGAYPVGSTFKPVTALASLASGTRSASEVYNDTGCAKIGQRDQDRACNAGSQPNGPVDLVTALEVSSDTYFYTLAMKMFHAGDWSIQDWASKLGFGRSTGIDIPGAVKGNIPSPAWYKELNRKELKCRKERKVSSCGYGSGDAVYQGGEQAYLAVGQGGFQASPLQLALAYSGIVTGGTVPTPHIGKQIDDSRGFVQQVEPEPARKVEIKPADREAVMRGLFAAANGDRGTSTKVWRDGWQRDRFPIYGKTGTAETSDGSGGLIDQSWYAAYSYRGTPDRDPIVVVATVERGGFGADVAAPVVRLILSQYFGAKKQLVEGTEAE